MSQWWWWFRKGKCVCTEIGNWNTKDCSKMTLPRHRWHNLGQSKAYRSSGMNSEGPADEKTNAGNGQKNCNEHIVGQLQHENASAVSEFRFLKLKFLQSLLPWKFLQAPKILDGGVNKSTQPLAWRKQLLWRRTVQYDIQSKSFSSPNIPLQPFEPPATSFAAEIKLGPTLTFCPIRPVPFYRFSVHLHTYLHLFCSFFPLY